MAAWRGKRASGLTGPEARSRRAQRAASAAGQTRRAGTRRSRETTVARAPVRTVAPDSRDRARIGGIRLETAREIVPPRWGRVSAVRGTPLPREMYAYEGDGRMRVAYALVCLRRSLRATEPETSAHWRQMCASVVELLTPALRRVWVADSARVYALEQRRLRRRLGWDWQRRPIQGRGEWYKPAPTRPVYDQPPGATTPAPRSRRHPPGPR